MFVNVAASVAGGMLIFCRNEANRAGGRRVSAAEYTAVLIFVFMGKLLHIVMSLWLHG
jgi:hypothetical protein